MNQTEKPGNARLRLRTRKHLLEAAVRLLKRNLSPTLEDVAEEAQVSRATAYRYFPSIDSLLNEAGLDVAFPDAETLFSRAGTNPVERVILADRAVDAMIEQNEQALRHMLIHSLKGTLAGTPGESRTRQNRRAPLIAAALDPVTDTLPEKTARRLNAALALFIGTESMLVFKDVLDLNRKEAADAKAWAIRALVAAALNESEQMTQQRP